MLTFRHTLYWEATADVWFFGGPSHSWDVKSLVDSPERRPSPTRIHHSLIQSCGDQTQHAATADFYKSN